MTWFSTHATVGQNRSVLYLPRPIRRMASVRRCMNCSTQRSSSSCFSRARWSSPSSSNIWRRRGGGVVCERISMVGPAFQGTNSRSELGFHEYATIPRMEPSSPNKAAALLVDFALFCRGSRNRPLPGAEVASRPRTNRGKTKRGAGLTGARPAGTELAGAGPFPNGRVTGHGGPAYHRDGFHSPDAGFAVDRDPPGR